jgi:microcompartment protein CcmK/EutM
MRLGFVRGQVVLSLAAPALAGTTLLIVEPVTAENLEARNLKGGGRSLIVADHNQLSPGEGGLIAFVEGAEAANAYYPGTAPVDAYCALVVRDYEFRPPATEPGPGREGH